MLHKPTPRHQSTNHLAPATAAAALLRIFFLFLFTSSRAAAALRRLRSLAEPLPPRALGCSCRAKLAATWPRCSALTRKMGFRWEGCTAYARKKDLEGVVRGVSRAGKERRWWVEGGVGF